MFWIPVLFQKIQQTGILHYKSTRYQTIWIKFSVLRGAYNPTKIQHQSAHTCGCFRRVQEIAVRIWTWNGQSNLDTFVCSLLWLNIDLHLKWWFNVCFSTCDALIQYLMLFSLYCSLFAVSNRFQDHDTWLFSNDQKRFHSIAFWRVFWL